MSDLAADIQEGVGITIMIATITGVFAVHPAQPDMKERHGKRPCGGAVNRLYEVN